MYNNCWKKAEFTHEQLAKNYGKRSFKIKVQDRELLTDHLTFLLTTDTKLITNENERKVIEDIIDKVLEQKKNDDNLHHVYVLLICTFIHIDETGCALVPLIRYRHESEFRHHFIDHTARSYHTWDNFLSDNIWKGLAICLPKHGLYKQDNSLCFLENVSTENATLDSFKKKLDEQRFDSEALMKNSAFISNSLMNYLEWFSIHFTDNEVKQFK